MRCYKYFLLIVSAAVFIQCSDDDEGGGNTVFDIISPVQDAVLYGDVNISATVADEDGVRSVKVFIDDATVPLWEGGDGDVDFNTRADALADGRHTVRFVATDRLGNTAEARVEVTVSRTIFTYSVPPGYIQSYRSGYKQFDMWLFLSDASGNVLRVWELQDNTDYTFDAPDGYREQDLTVTVFRYFDPMFGDRSIHAFESYYHVSFGHYGIPKVDNLSDVKGTSYLKLTDLPNVKNEGPWSFASSSAGLDDITPIGSSGTYCEFSMIAAKGAVLVADFRAKPMKYLYQELALGETYTRSQADFLTSETRKISFPVAGTGGVSISGINNYGYFPYLNLQVTPVGLSFDVSVPAKIFTAFQTEILYHTSDAMYLYHLRDKNVPGQMRMLAGEGTFSIQGNRIVANSTGDADVVRYSSESAYDPSFIHLWDHVMPTGQQSEAIPLVPQELKTRYVDLLSAAYVVNTTRLYDYAEFSGYSRYVAMRLKPDWEESADYVYKTPHIPSSVGRALPRQEIPDFMKPFRSVK